MLELRPILSALWRNKIAALLIAVQLALTLAIVGNSSIIVGDRLDKIARPTGIAVEDIIAVTYYPAEAGTDIVSMARADLDMLRAMPGVIDAVHSNHIPLSGSGSASDFYREPNQQIDDEVANVYHTGPEFLQTLGLKLVEGRNFTPADMETWNPNDRYHPKVTIVTKQFADIMFPEGNALGKFIYGGGDNPIEIIGIVERHLGAWTSWAKAGSVAFYPSFPKFTFGRYLIRTEPGKRDQVFKAIEERLAQLEPNRVIDMQTLSERLNKSYARENLMVKVLSAVIGMLTFIIALGIVGLTFFWINQRRKQIGVRRALGATRTNISRYFLVENCLIAGSGIAIGMAAAQIGNHFMVANYSQPALPLSVMLVCALMLLCVSLVAALVPALRAANISPATATRSV
ncbi:ABC transporter permease [Microbulbifer taiwanensis]|uniref:ABC transporter permease n=1 Tax=Microbulbifer taiwanensis TaxID=986746 RepID=A0ABW1YPS2_9GAMM|nr:FtsX-like permease family protein [Microbulbifer taiwanensis]